MRIIHWKYHNLVVPMFSQKGDVFGTSHRLSQALQSTPIMLSHMYNTNPAEFDGLRLADFLSRLPESAKDFLEQNKKEFGIERLRPDMHIWTEDDMLTFGFRIKSENGKEFRTGIRKLIKANARRDVPTWEEHNQLVSRLEQEHEEKLELAYRVSLLEKDKRSSDQAREAVQEAASEDGRALNRHKLTKEFRAMN